MKCNTSPGYMHAMSYVDLGGLSRTADIPRLKLSLNVLVSTTFVRSKICLGHHRSVHLSELYYKL